MTATLGSVGQYILAGTGILAAWSYCHPLCEGRWGFPSYALSIVLAEGSQTCWWLPWTGKSLNHSDLFLAMKPQWKQTLWTSQTYMDFSASVNAHEIISHQVLNQASKFLHCMTPCFLYNNVGRKGSQYPFNSTALETLALACRSCMLL